MVVNYSEGKRRFDSYHVEQEAVEAATKLARQMSELDVIGASMTKEQTFDYAQAVKDLAPYDVTLRDAASALAACLKQVGTLPILHEAVAFFRKHHRKVVAKPVADVATELQTLKEKRGGSPEYLRDLKYRLNRFTADCHKNIGDVTVDDLQTWLDGLELSTQSYKNFKTVLFTLFRFAERKGYCVGNPASGIEKIKVKRGDIEIFTPAEIRRLLAAAPYDFIPSLAIGAFAGLRSAEILRLDWRDVDTDGRCITVGVSTSKTASRRIVPITDNLAEWLQPHSKTHGKVWPWPAHRFYWGERDTAIATAVAGDAEKGIKPLASVKWKANALRHSFASYRLAILQDAGKVSYEMGNSKKMVFEHYRELVKPADAEKWFDVKPAESPENVLPMTAAAS